VAAHSLPHLNGSSHHAQFQRSGSTQGRPAPDPNSVPGEGETARAAHLGAALQRPSKCLRSPEGCSRRRGRASPAPPRAACARLGRAPAWQSSTPFTAQRSAAAGIRHCLAHESPLGAGEHARLERRQGTCAAVNEAPDRLRIPNSHAHQSQHAHVGSIPQFLTLSLSLSLSLRGASVSNGETSIGGKWRRARPCKLWHEYSDAAHAGWHCPSHSFYCNMLAQDPA
jgi:hypothetical protein